MDKKPFGESTNNSERVALMLGQIDGKLDSLISRHDELHAEHDRLVERIITVEGQRSYMLGFASAIGAIFGIVGTYVAKTLGLHV